MNRMRPGSFNPSVGILWGGTTITATDEIKREVSIPRSGFCGVGLFPAFFARGNSFMFQSLGRDSVGWDLFGKESLRWLYEFQSLGRDSVGWDSD